MERSDRNKPEEIALEDLHKQNTAVCQAQGVDGLKLDKESQKNGNVPQKETSNLCIPHDTLKPMQEKEPAKEDKTQDSQPKIQKSKTSEQAFRELSKDEKLELQTDANLMDQQSSFGIARDSSQTKLEAGTVHQEYDAFEEDKLLESDRYSTAQQMGETPESAMLVTYQKSIQEDNDATPQECDRTVEIESKSATNKEESLVATVENPLQAAEREANGIVQEESDRTLENDRYIQDNESGPESDEPQVCLRTQQLEDDASGPLPRRTCHHRACNIRHHILQESRLPPLQEDPEPPPEPFEVEIEVRRLRILGARLLALPTEIRDYMQRVRDRHIPPGIRFFCQGFPRCGILNTSILIGAILIVAFYYSIDLLERRYDNNDFSNVTSPLTDFDVNLNSSVSTLIPELPVTDLDVNITTPEANLDTEVIPAHKDMNFNGINDAIYLK